MADETQSNVAVLPGRSAGTLRRHLLDPLTARDLDEARGHRQRAARLRQEAEAMAEFLPLIAACRYVLADALDALAMAIEADARE